MKSMYPSLSLLFAAMFNSSVSFAKDDTAILEGPYLGQKLPGLTAEPFAPGIVNTKGFDDGGVFSPDMTEFYFVRERLDNLKMESVIYKQKNNRWIKTIGNQAMPFYPAFAPDGKTMHLGKQFKVRTATGWSKRKDLGADLTRSIS